jgi:hypothetical protein
MCGGVRNLGVSETRVSDLAKRKQLGKIQQRLVAYWKQPGLLLQMTNLVVKKETIA